MLPEFLDIKTIYLILHVFGAILGAGGAFMSDIMFFATVKDGIINKEELRFMRLGGSVVWTGLLVLIISGILLFYTDPVFYANSQKFLVKVSIVVIIFINGIIFHTIHLPHLKKHQEIEFTKSKTFRDRSSFVMISGAISMTSWVTTIILGMLKTVPYSYLEILSVYLTLLLLAMLGAFLMKNIILFSGR
ncbi:MAG: hypothetical protein WC011_01085 [Candidatus Paceibacterota bacterium]